MAPRSSSVSGTAVVGSFVSRKRTSTPRTWGNFGAIRALTCAANRSRTALTSPYSESRAAADTLRQTLESSAKSGRSDASLASAARSSATKGSGGSGGGSGPGGGPLVTTTAHSTASVGTSLMLVHASTRNLPGASATATAVFVSRSSSIGKRFNPGSMTRQRTTAPLVSAGILRNSPGLPSILAGTLIS